MAAGGGGAWKVAYADFVTAMMAFFLVMWICTQDQKIKEAVAHYFRDPLGGTPFGVSKAPSKAGAIMDAKTHGSVPAQESAAMGRGRSSHTRENEFSLPTKVVSDWLHSNDEAMAYWRKQAARHRAQAIAMPEVRSKKMTVDEFAAGQMARQLNDEVTAAIPRTSRSLHRELLLSIISEVNWQEIAEDILQNPEGD